MKFEWNPDKANLNLKKHGVSLMENNQDFEDDLRPEYDFSRIKGGVRGKYVERYRTGTNIVLLDPDVAEAFPTSKAVNEALRLLMQIAQR